MFQAVICLWELFKRLFFFLLSPTSFLSFLFSPTQHEDKQNERDSQFIDWIINFCFRDILKYAYFYLPFPSVKKVTKMSIDKLGCSEHSENYFHFALYLKGAEILHRKGNRAKMKGCLMSGRKYICKHMSNIQNIQRNIHTTEK